MSSVSLTEFHRQRFSPIFEQIERACQQINVDFYLVGAVARDISMALHGLKAPRVTRDLDLAVLVPTESDYQQLRDTLLAQGDFAEVKAMPFTLKYAEQTDVDLLPFGGLELSSGIRVNRGEGVARLAVTGFAEVYEHGTKLITLDEQFTFRVCDLPGMVLLKLIAYDDRPEHRGKDLADISFILKHYLDITEAELFDSHYDLIENQVSSEQSAARILGRHIRPLLEPSAPLRKRITGILDRAIAEGPAGSVIRQIQAAQYRNAPLDTVLHLVQSLRKGLDDTPITEKP
jgi:predicted nucleotidyltransferase